MGRRGASAAQLHQRLHAAHAGHVDVQQNHVEGLRLHQVQRLFAAGGLGGDESHLAQGRPQRTPDGRLIIDQQDADGRSRRTVKSRANRSSLAGGGWQGRVEGGSLLDVAGDPDVSTLGLGRTLGYGEADAGAGRPIGGSRRPVIAVEDALEVRGGNRRPDSCARRRSPRPRAPRP